MNKLQLIQFILLKKHLNQCPLDTLIEFPQFVNLYSKSGAPFVQVLFVSILLFLLPGRGKARRHSRPP